MLGMTAGLAIAETLITNGAGAAGSDSPVPSARGDAAAEDAARFEQALSVAFDEAAPAPWHAPVGEAVARLNRDWDALRRAALPPIDTPLSPSMILALQHQTLEVTMQMDLANKVIQKSVQAVDQLVRIQ